MRCAHVPIHRTQSATLITKIAKRDTVPFSKPLSSIISAEHIAVPILRGIDSTKEHPMPIRLALIAAMLSTSIGSAQPPAATAPADPPAAPNAPNAAPPVSPREKVRERVQERLFDNVEVHRDLEYCKVGDAQAGERSLKLDLFTPKGLDGPAPLVIWVHGGGWSQGNKDNCPALPFLRDGFAVASVQYRLTDVAPFPAQIHDVKAAVRYLRSHAKEHNLDPARFGAWGASAGGHLVALLGTSGDVKDLEGNCGNTAQPSTISSRVQCVCDWFGPSDFTNMPGAEFVAGGAVVKLLGGKPSEKPDVAAAASPVTHITADDPPFLIMHGDEDKVVDIQQSEILEEKLRKAGVSVKLEVLKGQGHGFRTRESLESVRTFFKEQLKPHAPVAPGATPTPQPPTK